MRSTHTTHSTRRISNLANENRWYSHTIRRLLRFVIINIYGKTHGTTLPLNNIKCIGWRTEREFRSLLSVKARIAYSLTHFKTTDYVITQVQLTYIHTQERDREPFSLICSAHCHIQTIFKWLSTTANPSQLFICGRTEPKSGPKRKTISTWKWSLKVNLRFFLKIKIFSYKIILKSMSAHLVRELRRQQLNH